MKAPSGKVARVDLAPGVARVLESLTERERRMLELLAGGASNQDIADALEYQEGTIRVYLHHLYKKLGVPNKTGAVVWWLDAKSARVKNHPDQELLDWIADQVAAAARMDDAGAKAFQRARAMAFRFNQLVKRRVHPHDALRRAVAEARL